MSAFTGDEQIDIKPDISMLCCNTLHTNTDCLNVKCEGVDDCTSTTSSYNADVQTDSDVDADEEQFDTKPLACVQCHNLLSYDDDKLNMVPLVVMKQFDVTKLVYPLPNDTSHGRNLPTNNSQGLVIGDPLDKPYICFYCGKGLRSIAQHRIHSATHSIEKSFRCTECDQQFWTQKQVVMHLMMQCTGR